MAACTKINGEARAHRLFSRVAGRVTLT